MCFSSHTLAIFPGKPMKDLKTIAGIGPSLFHVNYRHCFPCCEVCRTPKENVVFLLVRSQKSHVSGRLLRRYGGSFLGTLPLPGFARQGQVTLACAVESQTQEAPRTCMGGLFDRLNLGMKISIRPPSMLGHKVPKIHSQRANPSRQI